MRNRDGLWRHKTAISLAVLAMSAIALSLYLKIPGGYVLAGAPSGNSEANGVRPPERVSWLGLLTRERVSASEIDIRPLPMNRRKLVQKEINAFLERSIADRAWGEQSFFHLDDGLKHSISSLSESTIVVLKIDKEYVASRWNRPETEASNETLWIGYMSNRQRLVITKVGENVAITLPDRVYVESVPGTDVLVAFQSKHIPAASTKPQVWVTTAEKTINGYGPSALETAPDVRTADRASSNDNRLSIGIIRTALLSHDDGSLTSLPAARKWLETVLNKPSLLLGTSLEISASAIEVGGDDLNDADERIMWNDLRTERRESRIWHFIEVPTMKSKFDLILLLSGSNAGIGYCGQAQKSKEQKDRLVAIINVRCLREHTILAHEVGHLLGAEHEPHKPRAYAQPDAHAWRWPSREMHDITEPWRYTGTVTADEVRWVIPMFSDAEHLYGAERIGHISSANQAKHVAHNMSVAAKSQYTQDLTHDTDRKAEEHKNSLEARPCEAITMRSPSTCINDDDGQVVLFQRGSSVLAENQEAIITEWIRSNVAVADAVVVSGHASRSGSMSGNLVLSRERARSVDEALTRAMKSRSTSVPVFLCVLGHERPACAEGRAATEEENQRAVIRYIGR